MTVPARAIKTGRLALGPGFAIPCSIYSGTEDNSVSRSEFVKADDGWHPVGRMPYDKSTGTPVTQDQIRKGILHGDKLVEITDEELEACQIGNPGNIDILGFRPLTELESGQYPPKGIYQVRPAKTGTGKHKQVHPQDERAFVLLVTAMRKNKVFALVKFSFRGSFQYGALTPNGRMYALRFTDDIREELPMPESDLTSKEIETMTEVVKRRVVDYSPLVDETSVKVAEYVEQKAAGNAEPIVDAQPMPSVQDLEDMIAGLLDE